MVAPIREALGAWPEPAAETVALNRRIEMAMVAAPPPGSIAASTLRAARLRGEGVLPQEHPLDGSEWRPLPSPAPGGPDVVRFTPCAAAAPRGVALHIHGGGWTIGAPELADARCREIADAAQIDVFSAKYRLGPEEPWPAAGDDCVAAADAALAHAAALGGAPVFLCGESAGAHLALTTWRRLKSQGRSDAVAAVALTYGMFDLRLTPSAANWGDRGLILSTPIVRWFVSNLLGDRPDLASDPDASPLLADLSNPPPALIQCGTADPLIDDSLFLAQRWRAAGGVAELMIWPGGAHAFDQFVDDPDGRAMAVASRAATAEFLRGRASAR